MKMTKFYWIFYFIFNLQYIFAQENRFKYIHNYDLGFHYGIGSQSVMNVNYDYQVDFYQGQIYFELKRKKKYEVKLVFLPQFNRTKYKYTIDSFYEKDFEFGINTGILIKKLIIKDILNTYTSLSFGPHFISGAPKRQSNGFIFSDNIFGGFEIKIINNFYFDLRFGFRHLSNASIKKPNGGINNSFISIGLIHLNKI